MNNHFIFQCKSYTGVINVRVFTLWSLMLLMCTLFISCGKEEPNNNTPVSKKNTITVEGVDYPIQYFLVEKISHVSNDRMLEVKSYLNPDSSKSIVFFADLSHSGSSEIPFGDFTFTGPYGIQRSGFRGLSNTFVVLYNQSLLVDIITSANLQVSGEDGKNIIVKGTINYDNGSGVQKIQIDYNGPYEFD